MNRNIDSTLFSFLLPLFSHPRVSEFIGMMWGKRWERKRGANSTFRKFFLCPFFSVAELPSLFFAIIIYIVQRWTFFHEIVAVLMVPLFMRLVENTNSKPLLVPVVRVPIAKMRNSSTTSTITPTHTRTHRTQRTEEQYIELIKWMREKRE